MTKREAWNRIQMTIVESYLYRASKPDPYFSVNVPNTGELKPFYERQFYRWWMDHPKQIAKKEFKLDQEAAIIIEKILGLKPIRKKLR